MKAKAKSRRVSSRRVTAKKQKTGLSWRDLPALLLVLAILVGIAIAAKQYVINASEAATLRAVQTTTLTPQTTTNSTVQRSEQEQAWIKEASDLWHVDYNKCYALANGPAKCNCMQEVLDKYEDLRARILADGKDHQEFIKFWIDYYEKLIRQTMAALGCGSATSTNAGSGATTTVKTATPKTSVFSRFLQFFRNL